MLAHSATKGPLSHTEAQVLKVMSTIYHLLSSTLISAYSLALAVEVFREFLLNHLARSDKTTWVEQCVVILVWMLATSDMTAQRSLDIITETVKRLTELGQGTLGEHATHASLVVRLLDAALRRLLIKWQLVWRSISTAVSNRNFHDAVRWCTLMLEQPMFRNCSKDNKAKLQRLVEPGGFHEEEIT